MNKKSNTTVVLPAFDFSTVSAGERPAKSASEDTVNAYYRTEAGLMIDAVLDAVAANKGNISAQQSAVVTFIAQMPARRAFNLVNVAKEHELCSVAVTGKKLESAATTAAKSLSTLGFTADQIAAILSANKGA
jgi:hypothetical protein